MLDEITISLSAGDGGNGAVSFRRERYVPRGGPDGGDAGKGGDIIFRAEESVQVLDGLRQRRVLRAERGKSGGPARRHGRNGREVIVPVPVGTIVWKEDGEEQMLADLRSVGMEVVAARGGIGGRGNARLATSTRRVPRIAEKGLLGERVRIRLELRLLAEIGLVGLPNAGKSSLLRAMSEAKPKVGAYPFTTVEPHLGLVVVGYEAIIVADIPGLMEGAHEGAGLGTAFLQHIRRTRVLVQVVDGDQPDPLRDVATVRGELEAFGHGLAERRWLVALNKMDLPTARAQEAQLVRGLKEQGIEVWSISALTGAGVSRLGEALLEVVREERARSPEVTEPTPVASIQAPVRERIRVVRVGPLFEVQGQKPARVVAMLGVESEEARAEVLRRFRRMGVGSALRRAGVQPGDRIRIGEVELKWSG